MFRRKILPHNLRIKDRKVGRRGQKSGRDKEMNVVTKERVREGGAGGANKSHGLRRSEYSAAYFSRQKLLSGSPLAVFTDRPG